MRSNLILNEIKLNSFDLIKNFKNIKTKLNLLKIIKKNQSGRNT